MSITRDHVLLRGDDDLVSGIRISCARLEAPVVVKLAWGPSS